jgi:hypothetical protein
MRKFIAVAALSLFSLSVASAKSYEITVSNPTKAGTAQLKPGKYKIKVEGANATFVEEGKNKGVTVPVKVKEGSKKFDDTRVHSAKDGAAEKILDIELGGSKTVLEF